MPGFTPTYNMSSEAAPPIFEPSTRQDSNPFTLCKISGNIKVCAGCRNKYHQMIYVLNIKNGVSMSQKVHKHRNTVLEMLTITSIPRA